LVLAACATAPKTPELPLNELLPLDSGATAYILVDVPQARPILNKVNLGGYNSAQLSGILDKTSFAAAALYPPESGQGIRAVAWGNYPSFRAGLAFGTSKEWKRQRSATGKTYWYSAGRRVSLALERNRAFAALDPAAAMFAPAPTGTTAAPVAAREAAAIRGAAAGPYAQEPGINIPEGFNGFREGAPLALWMENPAGFLDRFLGALRLPIRIPAERLMAALSVLPSAEPSAKPPAGLPALPKAGPDTDPQNSRDSDAGTQYEIRLRIKTPSETSARTFLTLFSTARLFVFRSGGLGEMNQETLKLLNILFARQAEQQGAYIILRSPSLDENDIALLFNLFSVYSQGEMVIN
jgi:hypothetical protein